ncbi:hypothetical protein [Glycomyces sp. MUSA5-2]|uniref:hypothetical protein n=1 Tax=Glycomyces sp. MUSA5-2 TaxID=2053002 RepID=UPI0030085245
MPTVTVASLSGAPGVTATALALGAWWPEPDRVVVEADPSGGSLAVRCGLDARPGLVEVAVADGHDDLDGTGALAEGVQTARCGGRDVPVVCAPVEGVQAAPTIRRLTRPDSKALHPSGMWVVADCGRAWPASPAWPLLARSDLLVLVVPGTVAQSMNALGAVPALHRAGVRVACLVAAGRYDAEAFRSLVVAEDLHLPVLGDLPPEAGPGRARRGSARAWKNVAQRARECARVPMAAIGAASEWGSETS